ncbi:efflux RND transporter periplasmic adaptor subunit [Ramlibacter rhizophilus]|uniref:HlyD family efflux transporter periplasmic adaptor subunit n=1 Tax=Ramlibacter rhizophilus TaxID=1781167 RepID=A0A4Z0C053_9BURK|nr:HlyD family efflux transporter periplasmic adaptor subunit [Ramlibacter rhizophilus]TFZ04977.1 HlyD family efflux transporter periplasmic adaptor subunit [Ramlibacter rhizophilus]
MRKRTLIGWSMTSVVLLAALAWAFAPRPVAVETGVVGSGPFEESIEEDGRTRLKDRYAVSAPVAARLTRIVLREGDRVAAGDTVAVLLPALPTMMDERAVREASARHAAATASVQRARAALERAAVKVEETQLELHRTAKLTGEGFLSAARLDSARLAFAAAQRDHEAARAEQEVAVQERERAAAALQPLGAATPARPLTLRSPVDGVVLRVVQPSEATLPVGTVLMEIGDPSRMEIVAEMLTTDAIQAQPGRRAVIERWGGEPVQGRVRRVEPAAFTKVSALGIEEQRVAVLIDLDHPPPAWDRVGDGFRVTARVVTRSVDAATLVPVGALFPYADGGLAAYRLENGRARLQPVEIGGRNASQAWVRSGLSPGQVVIVYPPPTVAEGVRVRARR